MIIITDDISVWQDSGASQWRGDRPALRAMPLPKRSYVYYTSSPFQNLRTIELSSQGPSAVSVDLFMHLLGQGSVQLGVVFEIYVLRHLLGGDSGKTTSLLPNRK